MALSENLLRPNLSPTASQAAKPSKFQTDFFLGSHVQLDIDVSRMAIIDNHLKSARNCCLGVDDDPARIQIRIDPVSGFGPGRLYWPRG